MTTITITHKGHIAVAVKDEDDGHYRGVVLNTPPGVRILFGSPSLEGLEAAAKNAIDELQEKLATLQKAANDIRKEMGFPEDAEIPQERISEAMERLRVALSGEGEVAVIDEEAGEQCNCAGCMMRRSLGLFVPGERPEPPRTTH